MSNMRSASSSARYATIDSEIFARSTRSMSRPGVAMSTSHPRSISRNCCAAGAPPYTTTDLTPVWYANLRLSSWIWIASSRVGAITSAIGNVLRPPRGPPWRPLVRMPWMMGKQNAAVFPDPVCAHAIRSLRAMEMGIAYFCTGVGFLNLHRSMFLFTAAPKSMSWNVLMDSSHGGEHSTGMSSYISKSIPVLSPYTGASPSARVTEIVPASPIASFAARSSASCFANGSSSRLNRPELAQPPPPRRSSRRP
mmetsp:Transcript_10503/g.44686  ORF Transcript_10503/g.44686 Transcript_10503/m.44686 type:complete len:252 (+) Transcript_10503:1011-1766(+)